MRRSADAADESLEGEVNVERGSHRLTLPQLLLGTIKVKVNIETLHKLCDGVLVGVGLLWGGKHIFKCCSRHEHEAASEAVVQVPAE